MWCTNLHHLNCIRHRSRQCLRQPSIGPTSDSKYQYAEWGYKQTTNDGEPLSDWSSSAEGTLLYDPKEPPELRDWTSGKLTGSYSPQRLKEEHQLEHPTRLQQTLYILGWDAAAATTSSASSSRPPPRKTSTQRQHHYSVSMMKYAGSGIESRRSLWTSHIKVARRYRQCPNCTGNAIDSQRLNNGRFPDADKDFALWTSRHVT